MASNELLILKENTTGGYNAVRLLPQNDQFLKFDGSGNLATGNGGYNQIMLNNNNLTQRTKLKIDTGTYDGDILEDDSIGGITKLKIGFVPLIPYENDENPFSNSFTYFYRYGKYYALLVVYKGTDLIGHLKILRSDDATTWTLVTTIKLEALATNIVTTNFLDQHFLVDSNHNIMIISPAPLDSNNLLNLRYCTYNNTTQSLSSWSSFVFLNTPSDTANSFYSAVSDSGKVALGIAYKYSAITSTKQEIHQYTSITDMTSEFKEQLYVSNNSSNVSFINLIYNKNNELLIYTQDHTTGNKYNIMCRRTGTNTYSIKYTDVSSTTHSGMSFLAVASNNDVYFCTKPSTALSNSSSFRLYKWDYVADTLTYTLKESTDNSIAGIFVDSDDTFYIYLANSKGIWVNGSFTKLPVIKQDVNSVVTLSRGNNYGENGFKMIYTALNFTLDSSNNVKLYPVTY